jgi:hypothetical protein
VFPACCCPLSGVESGYPVPIVNFVLAVVVSIDFARKFGKGAGFGLGLVFLGFIFYPILAWGSAQHSGA